MFARTLMTETRPKERAVTGMVPSVATNDTAHIRRSQMIALFHHASVSHGVIHAFARG